MNTQYKKGVVAVHIEADIGDIIAAAAEELADQLARPLAGGGDCGWDGRS